MDRVEEIGIEYSKNAVEEADFVIFLYDAHAGYGAEDKEIFKLLEGKEYIIAANKIDLGAKELIQDALPISTYTKDGLEELKNRIKKYSYNFSNDDMEFTTNIRQQNCLENCRESLMNALVSARNRELQDLISIDLKSSLLFLDEITGEVITDEILNNIFEHFCIGK